MATTWEINYSNPIGGEGNRPVSLSAQGAAPHVVVVHTHATTTESVSATKWSARRILSVCAVSCFVVLAVALGIGLGVGMSIKKTPKSSSSGSSGPAPVVPILVSFTVAITRQVDLAKVVQPAVMRDFRSSVATSLGLPMSKLFVLYIKDIATGQIIASFSPTDPINQRRLQGVNATGSQGVDVRTQVKVDQQETATENQDAAQNIYRRVVDQATSPTGENVLDNFIGKRGTYLGIDKTSVHFNDVEMKAEVPSPSPFPSVTPVESPEPSSSPSPSEIPVASSGFPLLL